MEWPSPRDTSSRIDTFGTTLSQPFEEKSVGDWLDAYQGILHWRACHGYPMNTFQANLRGSVAEVAKGAAVVQRLKRFPSIEKKLMDRSTMRLSQMQDVAGLRAVMPDVASLSRVRNSFLGKKFDHQLIGTVDYLEKPRPSGYRSVHLIYSYDNKRAKAYKGLRVEVQLRTQLQHAWAMAVETIGHDIKSDLKGGQGPNKWLDFFQMASCAFAHSEGMTPVVSLSSLTQQETMRSTLEMADELGVESKLRALGALISAIGERKLKQAGAYQLVILDLDRMTVNIRTFRTGRAEQANEEYSALEQEQRNGRNISVVLVSAESIRTLKSAYSSFFLNSASFLKQLTRYRDELRG